MNHLPSILGLLQNSERQLGGAFLEMAKRYGDDYEFARGCELFAGWSETHIEKLDELVAEFGTIPAEEPAAIRKVLFQARQPVGVAWLWDIQDLLTLAHQTCTAWMSLEQAAKCWKNAQLNASVLCCSADLDREISWLKTQLKNAAPQAILAS
jgi:hypothetical protein